MKDNLSLLIEKLNSAKVNGVSSCFEDPRVQNFNNKKIDIKIRKILANINKSSWCWTLFSCQGHTHKGGAKSLPYMAFIVKNECKSKLLDILYDTLSNDVSLEFPLMGNSLEISSGYKDENFSLITVWWSGQFLSSRDKLKKLHESFEKMSEVIMETQL